MNDEMVVRCSRCENHTKFGLLWLSGRKECWRCGYDMSIEVDDAIKKIKKNKIKELKLHSNNFKKFRGHHAYNS